MYTREGKNAVGRVLQKSPLWNYCDVCIYMYMDRRYYLCMYIHKHYKHRPVSKPNLCSLTVSRSASCVCCPLAAFVKRRSSPFHWKRVSINWLAVFVFYTLWPKFTVDFCAFFKFVWFVTLKGRSLGDRLTVYGTWLGRIFWLIGKRFVWICYCSKD